MTQLDRLARGVALAAIALCAFAGALGCWSTVGEAKKSNPQQPQAAQQGPQSGQAPQGDEASQKAAAAAARKAYDAGLKEFANGKLQAAVDQMSVAVKAGGLSPQEMAKALYTRGVAYKKLNKPSLAISDLTSALWLKNGLSGNDRDGATRDRSEAYRMAGIEDRGSVPNQPVAVAPPASVVATTDSAGLSPKAIAEAATAAGKSGGPSSGAVAQPITRQDATSEAAQDAARARQAYAANDTTPQWLSSSTAGTAKPVETAKVDAPVVQSATVGPLAWSATAQPSSPPAASLKTYSPVAASDAPAAKVAGTFTLLNPAQQASTKSVAAPPVAVMNEAKAPPPPPAAAAVVWAQPSVKAAPIPAAPAAAPIWTPAAQPAASVVAPSASQAAVKTEAPTSLIAQIPAAAPSTWMPPPQVASASAAAASSTPAAEPAPEPVQPEVSVPMSTAGYISSLFASDLPKPPAPRRVSITTGSTESAEPETSSWSDSKAPTSKAAEKKSKAGNKSIVVAENRASAAKSTKYKVHIAALRSRAEAEALAQKLAAEHAVDLASHVPTVDEAVIGSMGTFYRVRISGYSSEDEPRRLCNKLRTSGLDCLVVTN